MCGIVGYIGTKKAVPVLIKGLLSLEYRGYDSAGLAILESTSNPSLDKPDSDSSLLNQNLESFSEIKVVKDKGRVKNLQDNPNLNSLNGTVGIAHTRWATHGVPSKENAHPHLDNSSTFAVVHNGIIENYIELKDTLLKNGYVLHSETDTEVIPNLISYNFINLLKKEEFVLNNKNLKNLKGLLFSDTCNTQKIFLEIKNINFENASVNLFDILVKAFSETLKELNGSYALEVISPLFPNKILVAKKDSPLVIGIGNNENYIASDIPAVLSHTNKFYFMDDEEIAVISKNNVCFYNLDLHSISKNIKDIEWDAVSSEKNGYDDYMLKEIYEQPQSIRETIGTSLSGKNINLPLENIDFNKFDKIFIVACGTAMHAGIATKYIFEKYCHIPTEVDMASEFRYRDPLVNSKTLCIFVSQSGETADTIAALKLAKSHLATTLAVVNVIGSTITRLADYTIYTHAGPEIAVASTKAYTCQVTLLSILALYISQNLCANSNCVSIVKDEIPTILKEIEHIRLEILDLPEKVKVVLDTSLNIKQIANSIYNCKDVFFIGRGTDYATSLEASLKLKEISYIHSEAYSAGELKHGPIALIENGVPVIGIATNEVTFSKTLSNLEEVITRGAFVTLITNQNISNDKISNIVSLPKCSYIISPIISVVPLQLLSYYIAKNKNLDVDKPRNLAKSVTVE